MSEWWMANNYIHPSIDANFKYKIIVIILYTAADSL